ncbi:MAG: hypothetical protein HUU46_02205, partial [Candidatus Hydrogenedentes bacterium]|nr:hypothetical protein [Candidatus Hydrogenedentota bacterium]
RRNAPRRLNDIPQNRSAAAVTPKRRGKRLKCYDFDHQGSWEFKLRNQLRRAFAVCVSDAAFEETMAAVRSTLDREVDSAVMLMNLGERLPRKSREKLVGEILEHIIERLGGVTAYGWMNAVTATARTVRDPEVRWELEKLGAMVPALVARARSARKEHESAIA